MKKIFKKGDRVFDIAYGWGIVVEVDDSYYSISVKFDGGKLYTYTKHGKIYDDVPPTLSFTEYTLEGFSQERPEELPEKDTLVYVRDNYSYSDWHMRYFSHKQDGKYCCFVSQRKSTETDSVNVWHEMNLKNPLL